MNLQILENYEEMSRVGAQMIGEIVKSRPNAVLGLATGATPEGVYANLAELYRAGELDFSSVRTVNLDEYYPISPSDPESYRFYMEKHLFSRINIKPENTHLPRGNAEDPAREAEEYESLVASLGYADIQLLGIGQNGHIGFNEPEDALFGETHLTPLTASTLAANARYFEGREMPTLALTMGMGTILRAKKILLLASGASKREAISALRKGRITTACPATFLLLHPDVTVLVDPAAAE